MENLLKNYSFVLLFMAVSFIAGMFLIFSLSEDGDYTQIFVQEGDTLWTLADQYNDGSEMNKEEFIAWVQKKNHLYTTLIKPGDELIIPIDPSAQQGGRQMAYNEE
ncbi:hypothetical protein JOC78_003138 [Bacillus ectoiniformans]|uniref:cell division suppressor protein YneA n=1 Tax=Bacillus ectoiniformans TaxID=1494429 RepID=UPI001EF7D662|nr:LysM peptidoglycan-binding domain-containing protein [Bacillus ectoiniformans]MBM7650154.1 hypothetical protein [Bacillus ectoiniformans]